MAFNWVDYSIIVLVLLSGLISFFRGFVKEAVSLVIWVVAVYLGLHFSPLVAGWFVGTIKSATVAYIAAFICIVILVLLVGIFVNILLSFLVSKSGVSPLDRLLGVTFGVVRGLLVVCVILLFTGATPAKQAKPVRESVIVPHLQPIISWLHGLIPEKMNELQSWLKVKTEEKADAAVNQHIAKAISQHASNQ